MDLAVLMAVSVNFMADYLLASEERPSSHSLKPVAGVHRSPLATAKGESHEYQLDVISLAAAGCQENGARPASQP